jgi:LCP family protein required for cell wall assembly
VNVHFSLQRLRDMRWPHRLRGSRSFAAFLSFVWPGLGQAYAGSRRLALLFALPALAVAVLAVYEARQGLTVFVARFIDPAFALLALLVIVGLGAWRLASVAHAYRMLPSGEAVLPRTRRNQRVVLGVLVAVIVATHGLAGALAALDYTAFSGTFVATVSLEPVASATPPADVYASPPPPSFQPTPTPAPIAGRTTILLAGVDAYAGRTERLYDSIMIVSLDADTNRVAMVSVPRDSAYFPLYFGGTVSKTTRINALVSYVQHGWIKSPDDPWTTFVKEVGYLVGIPIDYYAIMDLAGFVKMIDLVGGIDVNNPSVINDPVYDWLDKSPPGFYLAAGPQHLDGRHALAYVRSRHGADNSDWKRSSRQQQVLVALERKMASPQMLLQLPSLIQTLGSSVRTTFPANQIADMVARGDQIPQENISQVVLGPPYSDTGTGGPGISTTCLRLDKIAAVSVQLFGSDSRYYGKNQPDTCP